MEVIMGWKPIDTKLVKEILQQRNNGLSFDQIAQRCGIGATSVRKYFHAAEKFGLDWNQAKYHSR